MRSTIAAMWRGNHDLLLVFGMIGILLVLFTPLHPALLDLLLLLNIAGALLILMVTFYTEKPLSFSTFPSLLLMTTLFRLSLNIAATRLILGQGEAGKVIAAVGGHVVGGNYVVGLVVFLILIVVQYVVVTNGAQRVAEVAARFTLDSLPGKQMSIDADLNMGIIDHEQAKQRRAQLEKESNFYGAMDGASKFVKGDAIAGIIIILINIVGGLSVGIVQHDLSWGDALQRYTLLTVGDGIATQIPSLVIAVATGIIITRAATDARLGEEISRQVAAYPKAIWIVAVALLLLALLPGLPVLPIVSLSVGAGVLAYFAGKNSKTEDELPELESKIESSNNASKQADQSDRLLYQMMAVKECELVVGTALNDIALSSVGTFQSRLDNLRRQYARDYGFALPKIHISSELKQHPEQYTFFAQGLEIGRGELRVGKALAINPGSELDALDGEKTKEPTYGLPAIWIDESERRSAAMSGLTVVDVETVLITHLSELIRLRAADFLSRQEVERLVDSRRAELGGLADELIPSILTYSDLQRVLQTLLREGLSIRGLPQIMEVLVDAGRQNKNVEELTERVRERLGASICDRLSDNAKQLQVLTLAPELERQMLMSIKQGNIGLLAPGDLESFITKVAKQAEQQLLSNRQPVILCAGLLRRHLKSLLWRSLPQVHVLSVNEASQHSNVVSAGIITVDVQGSETA